MGWFFSLLYLFSFNSQKLNFQAWEIAECFSSSKSKPQSILERVLIPVHIQGLFSHIDAHV